MHTPYGNVGIYTFCQPSQKDANFHETKMHLIATDTNATTLVAVSKNMTNFKERRRKKTAAITRKRRMKKSKMPLYIYIVNILLFWYLCWC